MQMIPYKCPWPEWQFYHNIGNGFPWSDLAEYVFPDQKQERDALFWMLNDYHSFLVNRYFFTGEDP